MMISQAVQQISVLTIMVSLFLLAGCSDQSSNPDTEPFVDNISGDYILHGRKFESRYPGWPASEGEELSADTTYFVFTVSIELIDENGDTIRFYGLEGADAGSSSKKLFPDCKFPDDCKVIGKMTGINEFEISMENNGRTYEAGVIIRAGSFKLDGKFTNPSENLIITYDLMDYQR